MSHDHGLKLLTIPMTVMTSLIASVCNFTSTKYRPSSLLSSVCLSRDEAIRSRVLASDVEVWDNAVTSAGSAALSDEVCGVVEVDGLVDC
jgi:hypothetical protein